MIEFTVEAPDKRELLMELRGKVHALEAELETDTTPLLIELAHEFGKGVTNAIGFLAIVAVGTFALIQMLDEAENPAQTEITNP